METLNSNQLVPAEPPQQQAIPQVQSYTNTDFNTRMSVLKQIAKQTGVLLPATIIPEGESLIPYGEERQRALKDEIYALPTLSEAFNVLREVRAEQQPMDVKVPIQRVRMAPGDGGLYGLGHEGQKALAYTATSFGHIASFMKPQSVTSGFASTLLALPTDIRADAFNHFANTKVEDKQVVLRTLKNAAFKPGSFDLTLRRSIQSVVSERYSAIDDHELIGIIESVLPDGARVRYTQTETRSDLEILWPAMSRQLKVGDIALICLQVVNSQTKQYSIDIIAKLLRVLCLNFTTAWSDGADNSVNVRHVGDVKMKFRAAIAAALQVIEPFVLAFSDAYQKPLPSFAPTRGEAIGKFIKAYALPTKVGELMAAEWDADGPTRSAGDTLAGLANAATRVSQNFTFDNAEPLELAAGRIIKSGWDSIE